MLVTGLIVAYGYAHRTVHGVVQRQRLRIVHELQPHARAVCAGRWWTIMFCNVLTPQLLWFRQVRQNVPMMFLISIIVQIGMWTERFVIVITSLHRDFMPTAWGMYYPTFWDWSTLLGTIGFFLLLLLPVRQTCSR